MNLWSRLKQSPVIAGLVIGLLVGILVIAFRNGGQLQFLELAAYDTYLQFQPQEFDPDPHIVLIPISENDIRRLGESPISDQTLADLLEILLKCNPRVIGLDIYRDIPVPPGSDRLVGVLSNSDRIVTVKKQGDSKSPGVSQPYAVKNGAMVGFSDLLIDPGGVVRRALLFMDDGKETTTSFSLLMSLLYLKEDGIEPQSDSSNSDFLRLGKTTFVPVEPDDGSYVGVDARGYQVFADFSGVGRLLPPSPFRTPSRNSLTRQPFETRSSLSAPQPKVRMTSISLPQIAFSTPGKKWQALSSTRA